MSPLPFQMLNVAAAFMSEAWSTILAKVGTDKAQSLGEQVFLLTEGQISCQYLWLPDVRTGAAALFAVVWTSVAQDEPE